MFEIFYSDRVLKEDIPSLPSAMKSRIKKTIAEKLTPHPLEFGKPLRYSYKAIGVCMLAIGESSNVLRKKKNMFLSWRLTIEKLCMRNSLALKPIFA